MTYLQPLLPVFLLIAFFGWLRIRKTRGAGLVAIGLAGLFLAAWPPVDWLLSRALEGGYARIPASMDSAQSIVVLSGSFLPEDISRTRELGANAYFKKEALEEEQRAMIAEIERLLRNQVLAAISDSSSDLN